MIFNQTNSYFGQSGSGSHPQGSPTKDHIPLNDDSLEPLLDGRVKIWIPGKKNSENPVFGEDYILPTKRVFLTKLLMEKEHLGFMGKIPHDLWESFYGRDFLHLCGSSLLNFINTSPLKPHVNDLDASLTVVDPKEDKVPTFAVVDELVRRTIGRLLYEWSPETKEFIPSVYNQKFDIPSSEDLGKLGVRINKPSMLSPNHFISLYSFEGEGISPLEKLPLEMSVHLVSSPDVPLHFTNLDWFVPLRLFQKSVIDPIFLGTNAEGSYTLMSKEWREGEDFEKIKKNVENRSMTSKIAMDPNSSIDPMQGLRIIVDLSDGFTTLSKDVMNFFRKALLGFDSQLSQRVTWWSSRKRPMLPDFNAFSLLTALMTFSEDASMRRMLEDQLGSLLKLPKFREKSIESAAHMNWVEAFSSFLQESELGGLEIEHLYDLLRLTVPFFAEDNTLKMHDGSLHVQSRFKAPSQDLYVCIPFGSSVRAESLVPDEAGTFHCPSSEASCFSPLYFASLTSSESVDLGEIAKEKHLVNKIKNSAFASKPLSHLWALMFSSTFLSVEDKKILFPYVNVQSLSMEEKHSFVKSAIHVLVSRSDPSTQSTLWKTLSSPDLKEALLGYTQSNPKWMGEIFRSQERRLPFLEEHRWAFLQNLVQEALGLGEVSQRALLEEALSEPERLELFEALMDQAKKSFMSGARLDLGFITDALVPGLPPKQLSSYTFGWVKDLLAPGILKEETDFIRLKGLLESIDTSSRPWMACFIKWVSELPLEVSSGCLELVACLERKVSGDPLENFPKLLPDSSARAKWNFKLVSFFKKDFQDRVYSYLKEGLSCIKGSEKPTSDLFSKGEEGMKSFRSVFSSLLQHKAYDQALKLLELQKGHFKSSEILLASAALYGASKDSKVDTFIAQLLTREQESLQADPQYLWRSYQVLSNVPSAVKYLDPFLDAMDLPVPTMLEEDKALARNLFLSKLQGASVKQTKLYGRCLVALEATSEEMQRVFDSLMKKCKPENRSKIALEWAETSAPKYLGALSQLYEKSYPDLYVEALERVLFHPDRDCYIYGVEAALTKLPLYIENAPQEAERIGIALLEKADSDLKVRCIQSCLKVKRPPHWIQLAFNSQESLVNSLEKMPFGVIEIQRGLEYFRVHDSERAFQEFMQGTFRSMSKESFFSMTKSLIEAMNPETKKLYVSVCAMKASEVTGDRIKDVLKFFLEEPLQCLLKENSDLYHTFLKSAVRAFREFGAGLKLSKTHTAALHDLLMQGRQWRGLSDEEALDRVRALDLFKDRFPQEQKKSMEDKAFELTMGHLAGPGFLEEALGKVKKDLGFCLRAMNRIAYLGYEGHLTHVPLAIISEGLKQVRNNKKEIDIDIAYLLEAQLYKWACSASSSEEVDRLGNSLLDLYSVQDLPQDTVEESSSNLVPLLDLRSHMIFKRISLKLAKKDARFAHEYLKRVLPKLNNEEGTKGDIEWVSKLLYYGSEYASQELALETSHYLFGLIQKYQANLTNKSIEYFLDALNMCIHAKAPSEAFAKEEAWISEYFTDKLDSTIGLPSHEEYLKALSTLAIYSRSYVLKDRTDLARQYMAKWFLEPGFIDTFCSTVELGVGMSLFTLDSILILMATGILDGNNPKVLTLIHDSFKGLSSASFGDNLDLTNFRYYAQFFLKHAKMRLVDEGVPDAVDLRGACRLPVGDYSALTDALTESSCSLIHILLYNASCEANRKVAESLIYFIVMPRLYSLEYSKEQVDVALSEFEAITMYLEKIPPGSLHPTLCGNLQACMKNLGSIVAIGGKYRNNRTLPMLNRFLKATIHHCYEKPDCDESFSLALSALNWLIDFPPMLQLNLAQSLFLTAFRASWPVYGIASVLNMYKIALERGMKKSVSLLSLLQKARSTLKEISEESKGPYCSSIALRFTLKELFNNHFFDSSEDLVEAQNCCMEIIDEALRLSGQEGITGESLIKESNPRHIRLNEILALRREYEEKQSNNERLEASDQQRRPDVPQEVKDNS